MIYPFKVGIKLPTQSVIPKVGDVVWYVHTPDCVTSCQSEAVVLLVYPSSLSPAKDIQYIRIKFPRRDWGMNGEYDTFSNKCYPMRTIKGNIFTGDVE